LPPLFAGADQVTVSESAEGDVPPTEVGAEGFVVTGVEVDVVGFDGPAAFVAITVNV